MKMTLRLIALALLVLGVQPASACLLTTHVGSCGNSGPHPITTPLILQSAGTSFAANQGTVVNNALKPNNGTANAFLFPPTPTNSMFILMKGQIDPALGSSQEVWLSQASGSSALLVTGNSPGQPAIYLQRTVALAAGTEWWKGVGSAPNTTLGAATTGYSTGQYAFTSTGGNCKRNPTGVVSASGGAKLVDPGFLCGSTPIVDVTQIVGYGAQQFVGAAATPPQTVTSCVVVSGVAQVTFHMVNPHGVVPGQTFQAQGFTPSGFTSAAYKALPGTTGNTLIGTAGATCPAASAATDGSVFGGTGGSITMTPISATTPFASGDTGINVTNGQHICGIVGEYGDDSNFPGAQFAAFVDRDGNALSGAPATVPWLNQGTALFTGTTTTGAQPELHVTGFPTVTASGATYIPASGTTPAKVSFAISSGAPAYMPGSEFTVSGFSSTGASVNQTYVADGSTTQASTTIIGIPLVGPLGVPQALASPGTITGTGSIKSVIMPGMAIVGATSNTVVAPFAAGQTGQGDVGDYSVTVTQTGTLSGTLFAYSAHYFTASGTTVTARTPTAQGDFWTVIGSTSLSQPNGIVNRIGWGGTMADLAMVYGVFPMTGAGAPDMTQLAALCEQSPGNNLPGFAATNGLTVHSLYRMNDPGTWGDSGLADFSGSIASGSPAVLTASGGVPATLAAGATISGPGVAGCPLACPTITTGGAGPWNLTATVTQTTIGPIAMKAGAYKPAVPLPANQFNGYIDSAGLHVTSLPSAAVASGFTGTLGIILGGAHVDNGTISVAGNILTVGTPASPSNGSYGFLGIGTTIYGGSITSGSPVTITAMAPTVDPNPSQTACGGSPCTGVGGAGTYQVNSSAQTSGASGNLFASGLLSGPSNAMLINVAPTGTIVAGMAVTDGNVKIKGNPFIMATAAATTAGLSAWNVVPTYYPSGVAMAGLTGTDTTPQIGQYIRGSTSAVPLPYPVSITGFFPTFNPALGGLGDYTLSNNLNNVGSIGSPVALISTAIGDAGVVSPNPALTIKDLGPGVIFPITSATCSAYATCVGSGAITAAGTYDTSQLGGTPATIQAQISLTPGGAPVPGCSACAWTNLSGYSATLSSGTVWNYTGQAVNIPANGGSGGGQPLYVTVRASNGTAYATMTSAVKLGIVSDVTGEGQTGSALTAQSGTAGGYFKGVWGVNSYQGAAAGGSAFLVGPPVVGNFIPAYAQTLVGDRVGAASTTIFPESMNTYEQLLSNALGGWPVAISHNDRDGVGSGPKTAGYTTQAQTIAPGDGTSTVFCSATTYCPNASLAGPLYFSASAKTGGRVVNATLTPGTPNTTATLVVPAGNQTPSSLITTGMVFGALSPGMTLRGLANAPTLSYCSGGNCGFSAYQGTLDGTTSGTQTWQVTCSGPCPTVTSPSTINADPPSGPAIWSAYNAQGIFGLSQFSTFANGSFSTQVIQAGTFTVLKNGVPVCQDTTTFAYNVMGGNCTGPGVSGFVYYGKGDYQITFTTAPLATDVLTATWTNLMSPDGFSSPLVNHPQNFDFMGNGTVNSGQMTGMLAKTPGGVSAHIVGGDINDDGVFEKQGYANGAPALTQAQSWLYGTKYTTIPGQLATTPVLPVWTWRGEGPNYFNSTGSSNSGQNGVMFGQWSVDLGAPSQFLGSISGATLTLGSAAAGQMWEGEVIDCVTVGGSCPIDPTVGVYITGLLTGAWGANGSTYSLSASPGNVASQVLRNAVYYSGQGAGCYIGPLNDVPVQASNLANTVGYAPHLSIGQFAGRRVGARFAALTWGCLTGVTNASDPIVARTNDPVSGTPSPAFDYGNTYAAIHAGTWTAGGNVITITGGIAAHDRPFVAGQLLTFSSGGGTGFFITSVSLPPSQDTTRTNAGQVGNTFTITVANGSGGTLTGTSGTVTAGCSPGSGGSQCVNFDFQAGTTSGTFGTAWALATCGENNISGNSPNYVTPSGVCVNNGIGSLVRNFRIGATTGGVMWGTPTTTTPGAPYDDGADPEINFGPFNQSEAFTCNIVAAKTVQCVLGPAYSQTAHTLIGINKWTSGSTYAAYGDGVMGTTRWQTVQGYVGGQPFPITNPGSGYTNGTYKIAPDCGAPTPIQGLTALMDLTVVGGNVVNLYPSNGVVSQSMGIGLPGPCTISPEVTGSVTSIVAGTGQGAGQNGAPSGSGLLTVSGVSGGSVGAGETIVVTVGGVPTTYSVTGAAIIAGSNQALKYVVTPNRASAAGTFTVGSTTGTGAVIPTFSISPLEGVGGLGTYNSDNNMAGAQLYGNEGLPGNPLNPFFTNSMGGYWEPGLPVVPFGNFVGVQVSG
jgi:hypothetical protein